MSLSRRSPSSLRAWGLAILVLGISLRWIGVYAQPLWFDELMSIHLAQSEDLRGALLQDRHPPLFFRGLGALYDLGLPIEASRYFSVVLGTAAFLLSFFTLQQWLQDSALITARLLCAVSPFSIWYAREIRGYAWVELGLCLALWAMLVLRSTPARIFTCGIGAWFALGANYFGGLAALPVLAIAAGARRLKESLIAWGAAALLWAPWYLQVLPRQLTNGWGSSAHVDISSLVRLLGKLYFVGVGDFPPPNVSQPTSAASFSPSPSARALRLA